MTEDEAYEELQAFLKDIDQEAHVLDPAHVPLVQIVRNHQNAPRVVGSYAMITGIGQRDTNSRFDLDYSEHEVNDEQRIAEGVTRDIETKFRVDVYATKAGLYSSLFRNALRSARAEQSMPGLVVRRVDPMTTLSPDLVQSHWEGRAAFTVELASKARDAILIDTIETGTVELVTDGGSTIHVNTTYERQA